MLSSLQKLIWTLIGAIGWMLLFKLVDLSVKGQNRTQKASLTQKQNSCFHLCDSTDLLR